MTVATSTLLGRPLWYELMTTDMKQAEAFYRTVVGWKTAPFDGANHPYTMFNRGGDVSVGGVMAKPAEVKAPPFWAMYIGAPNLEEVAADIKRHGGTAHTEVIDVPKIGRMQLMMDPQGAAFYIYEPARDEQRPETTSEVGEASWHELITTDAPAAMKFYQQVFGWQPSDTMDMGPAGKYQMFNRPTRDDRRRHAQAAGDGQRATQLADLLPRLRRRRGGRAHQGRGRQDSQRSNGSSRRR